jgi:hypothetical protein
MTYPSAENVRSDIQQQPHGLEKANTSPSPRSRAVESVFGNLRPDGRSFFGFGNYC